MKKYYIVFLATSILFSCGKETKTAETASTEQQKLPCGITTITPLSLETEYGCTNTKYQMNIALTNTYRIINSQAEFTSLVSGSCLPTIDFAKYSLVIGKKGLQTGNRIIEYSAVRDCPNNKTILSVNFKQDLTATAPNLTYHALLPKLNANEQVDVQVTIQ